MARLGQSYLDDIEAIELAFVAQWAHFGQGPGGTFHDDGDAVWTEAPVPEVPYNSVLRTSFGANADDRIDEMIAAFRSRGVQFMWLVHPSAAPGDLAARLNDRGLTLVEHGTGMSLDLSAWRPEDRGRVANVDCRVADDEEGLVAYEELIAAYWELSEGSLSFVTKVNRWTHSLGHGMRFVAMKDGAAVGKAYLSFTVGPDAMTISDDTAAVFGVYVTPAARGLGVAGCLMDLALQAAAETGRRRVVLHSSSMAFPLYLRMGFTPRCPFPAFATTPLHTLQPA